MMKEGREGRYLAFSVPGKATSRAQCCRWLVTMLYSVIRIHLPSVVRTNLIYNLFFCLLTLKVKFRILFLFYFPSSFKNES